MSNHLFGITSMKINALVGGKKNAINLATFVASTIYTDDLCASRVVDEPNSELDHWQLEVKKVIQYVGRRKEYFQYLYEEPQYFVEFFGASTKELTGQLVYRVPKTLVGKKFTGVYDEYQLSDNMQVVGKLIKSGRSWNVDPI
jgi:hypothetical protein